MEITAKTLEEAILFATEKHKGVTRKGNGMPYITHPLAVMAILTNVKKSNNAFLIAVVAILHDVVEDCDVTIDDIAKEFGFRVAAIVQELTSNEREIELLGKKEYLLKKMLSMSSYGLRIKLADRLHNISDMRSLNTNAIERTIVDTEYILDGLADRKLTKTHKTLIKMIKKEIAKIN